MNRRKFISQSGLGLMGTCFLKNTPVFGIQQKAFKFNYVLASCMFGYNDLNCILPAVNRTNSDGFDIWPKIHGNQREQINEMGVLKFENLLKKYGVNVKVFTQYSLGPFNLINEIRFASKFGCEVIVAGSTRQSELSGIELRAAIQTFIDKIEPQVQEAKKYDIKIAIENHVNSLIESPESIRIFNELNRFDNLGIAFAPYHLPQDEKLLSELILDLGSSIFLFYAWQHGEGSGDISRPDIIKQLPGVGNLDFQPLVDSLKQINFSGITEIFMHSYPRGTGMYESTESIVDELNKSKNYLDGLI